MFHLVTVLLLFIVKNLGTPDIYIPKSPKYPQITDQIPDIRYLLVCGVCVFAHEDAPVPAHPAAR
jgi:hypothetical protein